jgi:hypothetical protein
MKLYLHNFLQDNVDGTPRYPLKIEPTEVRNETVPLNPEHIQSFVKRIDPFALVSACRDLGIDFTMPEDLDHLDDEQIRNLHHALFEVEVVTGELVSPSGRRFQIILGIPDMVAGSMGGETTEE